MAQKCAAPSAKEVSGLRFRIQGLGFRVKVWNLGNRGGPVGCGLGRILEALNFPSREVKLFYTLLVT